MCFQRITLAALLRLDYRKDKVESEGQLKGYYNNPGGRRLWHEKWLDSVMRVEITRFVDALDAEDERKRGSKDVMSK